ncbi:hypothetical protein [Acutalibacter sp. JLR.KK004]|jgi:hypothetical protein|uniref:hypothetical protein n=1 Tax=Acutalibacter sp. JLR.KK004 TaxID=3112622 RepID=UPI00216EB169|nr:hypothetical protein [Acutalibacter sp.]MCI9116636.1 hypothetical protein [Acutalibacter sp.]
MDKPHNTQNKQLENLLQVTAQRMGTTPEDLKTAAQNGDLSRMMGNMGAKESAAMQKVLTDPEAAKKLLSTPQAQALLNLLGGGKQK